jgi:hypothetical protein
VAKPKAPVWLREAFRDGVDAQIASGVDSAGGLWRPTAGGGCWLAMHDPAKRPCSGPPERFHFIPRQRVENAFGALIPNYAELVAAGELDPGGAVDFIDWQTTITDLTLLAAWDSRNGGLGCEHHHRRFDGHACSPRAPKIIVPRAATPYHLRPFVADWGLEHSFEERFPER